MFSAGAVGIHDSVHALVLEAEKNCPHNHALRQQSLKIFPIDKLFNITCRYPPYIA